MLKVLFAINYKGLSNSSGYGRGVLAELIKVFNVSAGRASKKVRVCISEPTAAEMGHCMNALWCRLNRVSSGLAIY